MDVLSTAFALFALLACGFLAWQCAANARDARQAAQELRKSQGTIAAHTLALDAHHAHLRRLEGRIAALKYRVDHPGRGDPDDDVDAQLRSPLPLADANGVDPDLAAALSLQSAPPVRPGSR